MFDPITLICTLVLIGVLLLPWLHNVRTLKAVYLTQFTVESKHLDRGDHANWLQQLAVAEQIHHAFREALGLSLDTLQVEHKLFLVMGLVEKVRYKRQLRLADVVEAKLNMWVAKDRKSLRFSCSFSKLLKGKVKPATEMSWTMPLMSDKGRSIEIPQWMIDIIETRAKSSGTPTQP